MTIDGTDNHREELIHNAARGNPSSPSSPGLARRDFLKGLGILAAESLLAGCGPSTPESTAASTNATFLIRQLHTPARGHERTTDLAVSGS
jgi:hypothetical protein